MAFLQIFGNQGLILPTVLPCVLQHLCRLDGGCGARRCAASDREAEPIPFAATVASMPLPIEGLAWFGSAPFLQQLGPITGLAAAAPPAAPRKSCTTGRLA